MLRINKRKMARFFLFIFLIYPSFRFLGFEMEVIGTGTPTYMRFWSILALAISVFLYIYEKKYDRKDWVILLYAIYCLGSSLYFKFNGADVALTSLMTYITAFFATIYFLKCSIRDTVEYFCWFFGAFYVINAIVSLTPINAIFETNKVLTFLGHIQIYSMLWVSFITFVLIRNEMIAREKQKIFLDSRFFFGFLIILATIITFCVDVTIAKIVILVFFLLYIFTKSKHLDHSKLLVVGFFVAILLNILMVLFNIHDKFLPIIQFFGENTSLNGRTYIWSVYLPKLLESPIWGYGHKVLGVDLLSWGSNYMGLDYCHNTLLQELSSGGFVQMVLFILVNLYSIRQISFFENPKMKHVAFCGFVCMYLIMISESVTYYSYFNIFCVTAIRLGIQEEKNCNVAKGGG